MSMRNWTAPLACAAAMLLAAPIVRADDDAAKDETVAKPKVGVAVLKADGENDAKAKVTGKVIVVGPDGKKQEFNFGDGQLRLNVEEALKGVDLPEEVRKHLREHRERVEKLHKEKRPDAKGAIVQGKAIIIGPDGKKREIDLGDGGALELKFDGDLPNIELGEAVPEEIRKRMQQAIERMRDSKPQIKRFEVDSPERRSAGDDAQIKRLQRQVQQLRKRIEELEQRLDKLQQ